MIEHLPESCKLVVMAVFALVLSSCGYDYKEILRVTNPDGAVDAVAIDLLTGATVATPTKIYVGDKGFEIKGEPVFVADYVGGLTMAWHGDANLIVRVEKARVFSFANSIDVKTSTGVKKISIVLSVEKSYE